MTAQFSPAHADFKICNRMSYVVEAAIGIDDGSATATRGWFRVDPAQCRTVAQGAFTADRILLHARALPLYGDTPITRGTDTLCVTPQDNFVIAAARQCRAGQVGVAFTAVKPTATDDGNATAYLSEDSDYDDEQARLAAIQRLLGIVGYDAAPIDGVDGRKTQAALSAFLKSKSLPADAAQAPAFIGVLVNAAQSPSATGLTWCNDTPHRVMAAIASDDGKAVTTRGWYRVEPGKCLRPDLAAQPGQVLSFAEAVDADNRVIRVRDKPLVWGGARTLCTRESKFEIADHSECASRGMMASGFTPVDLASGGKTLRFAMP